MKLQQQDANVEPIDRPLGLRLRNAREARGMSVNEVGERLKVPAAVVEAMEREDFERLGAPVYVRGHLHGYARLLDLGTAVVDAALAGRLDDKPPPLAVTRRSSRAHVLFDRYARRAVYVVLTASIVLPVIWLATQNSLPASRALLTPLDPAPGDSPGAPRAESDPAGERPVMATMTPFLREPASVASVPPPQPAAMPSPAPTEPTPAQLEFSFEGASWVEILDVDGSRLVYGLVEAGQEFSFPADRVRQVALGDAGSVAVKLDGAELDLEPFQRAKVARFALSSDGKAKPIGG